MTKGYPLDIVTYVIGILLLIKQLKAEFPDITQHWYADNFGAIGTFSNVKLYFNSLKLIRLGCGY